MRLSLKKCETLASVAVVRACVGSSLSPAHVAAQMRRLFGNIGSAQHQDALAAQDMDNVSDEENFEA